MEQTREPLFTPDAGKIVGKAVDVTQAALASDAGKAVRSVIAQGPDGLLQHLTKAAQKHTHDPVTQARLLLAEQTQNFDVMRSAIGKIGTSLAELNQAEPQDQHPHAPLLNAQAEAIQGLTLLVLKGQQVQAELINAVDGQAAARAGSAGMPKWIYYMMGAMMVWSMLGIIF